MSQHFSPEQLCSQAQQSFRLHCADKLRQIEARFDCGVLAGTSVQALFSSFNTHLMEYTEAGAHGAQHPDEWCPALTLSNVGQVMVLRVPAQRVAKHRNVMLCSYLLRAWADYHIAHAVPNYKLRKKMVRAEVDRVMFGEPEAFVRRLRKFGSLEAVHDADISLQLIAGMLSKVLPNTSLEVFFTSTPYYGTQNSKVPQPFFGRPDLIGSVKKSYQPVLIDWVKQGKMSLHYPQPSHAFGFADAAQSAYIMAISHPVSDIVNPYSQEPLVAVSKTVAWSCQTHQLHDLFV